MPEAHEMLHVAFAEDPSKLQSVAFADAFDALYAGVALSTGAILAVISSLPAPELGHWIVFLYGFALLIYGWRWGSAR